MLLFSPKLFSAFFPNRSRLLIFSVILPFRPRPISLSREKLFELFEGAKAAKKEEKQMVILNDEGETGTGGGIDKVFKGEQKNSMLRLLNS